MEQNFRGIYYKTYGKNHGYALVFLHGYLESYKIWNNFAELFSDEYFVICIDLPGHGQSLVPDGDSSSLDSMAEAVITITDHLGVGGFHLAGHSMGGYVSLALLENYAEKLNSIILFHSSCFADTEEKKANRDREIELVKLGKKELVINTSIPRLYATDRLDEMAEKVKESKEIAFQTSDAGIIYALNAMKFRPDRSAILANVKIPVLLIGGGKDNLIPFGVMEKMKGLSSEISLTCLQNSGHMGFLEDPGQAADELKKFLDASFECL